MMILSLIPKKYFIYASIALIFIVGVYNHFSASKEYDRTIKNLKAELADKDSSMVKSKYIHQLTIEELQHSNDSLSKKLLESAKEKNIKKKNIQSLQYISSTVYKVDTIVLRDTIFKESIKIDTTIQDSWHSTRVQLEYPNTIVVSPLFKSAKHIITSVRKETVNKPKKFWLFRLFQKKHKVLRVDIIERSPYAVIDTTKFIEIIK